MKLSAETLVVPQMVGFEVLTKIIIAYSKIGGDNEEKSYQEIAAVANVAANNVRLNLRFLGSIGILEGSRGKYKLSSEGAKYARALDWGKLTEANKILRDILSDKPIVKRTLGYVSINKPVDKETLVGQVAVISGVSKNSRFETGIRGFVDMLVTSDLIEEADGKYVIGKIGEKKEISEEPTKKKLVEYSSELAGSHLLKTERKLQFPITLNFNINNETNVDNLKKILEAIKEIFSG